jgi:hypothetical protein
MNTSKSTVYEGMEVEVATSLADLKEMCHCVFANYLTDEITNGISSSQVKFFSEIVAE